VEIKLEKREEGVYRKVRRGKATSLDKKGRGYSPDNTTVKGGEMERLGKRITSASRHGEGIAEGPTLMARKREGPTKES